MMSINKPASAYAIFVMALMATGTSHASPPVCSSTAFDVDGDGWGWENHRSCVVTFNTDTQRTVATTQSTTQSTRDTPAYLARHPVCTGPNPDPEGDGWGWENDRSCYVLDDGSNEPGINNINSQGSDDPKETDTSNTDNSTVVLADVAEKSRHPLCELATSDPDGDGWGWENSRSCIVDVSSDESANTSDASADTSEEPADTNEEPADTDADSPETVDAKIEDTDDAADTDSENSDSSIVYTQDFESAVSGLYQSDQLNEGWNQPFWHLGFDQGRVRIITDAAGGQVMQVTFPAGAYGSNGASAFLSDVQFGMELPKSYDELYLTYDIMFADGFEFVLGGKLPGLCGANSDSALTEGCNTGGGKPNGFDGWSARGMWRVDGALEHYTYHAGQQNYWADSLLWNVKAKRGNWHRVQHRVVLNTVGASDGILEAWFDGQKVLSNSQLEYRKTESVGINLFYFSTFFGGNDPSWAPKTDQILYFDNFIISTEKTN